MLLGVVDHKPIKGIHFELLETAPPIQMKSGLQMPTEDGNPKICRQPDVDGTGIPNHKIGLGILDLTFEFPNDLTIIVQLL